jgi:hypothetical protein
MGRRPEGGREGESKNAGERQGMWGIKKKQRSQGEYLEKDAQHKNSHAFVNFWITYKVLIIRGKVCWKYVNASFFSMNFVTNMFLSNKCLATDAGNSLNKH